MSNLWEFGNDMPPERYSGLVTLLHRSIFERFDRSQVIVEADSYGIHVAVLTTHTGYYRRFDPATKQLLFKEDSDGEGLHPFSSGTEEAMGRLLGHLDSRKVLRPDYKLDTYSIFGPEA